MSELRELSRTSNPDAMVTPMYGTRIDHPSAWKVVDFKTPADYTIELDAAHLRDIEHAMRQIRTAGLGLDDLQQVSQATIVENKHLGAVLSHIRDKQIERAEARSQSAPRRQGQVGHMFKVG